MGSRPSEIFGSHVFHLETMNKRLPKATFRSLAQAIESGSKLNMEHANAVAHVIMEWALEKGATHYTHLFQPMTGLTAQKHDAFFTIDSQLGAIERFTGGELIQSEPDASSFPSGGMRSTFEARGYTAWDPTSPVYLMVNNDVSVLCIPSVFFSYTGQALDKKTPLLRSMRTLNNAASRALELLDGRKMSVEATVGCEQEYFLVDQKYFMERPDLIMAGRTILGAAPAKGQQMEDHYFGSIKDRVLAYMQEMEKRLYELGVPCKTRHNEVAPHQFEMAPIFESANLAADHNQLMMEVMRKVAKEYSLEALLHEKPFDGVNGSGKHVNWSMESSDGTNLLEPGKEPHRNLNFLYFLVAVVNAIHKRGDILRSTIAGPGNDHRLGANEAPPAIMSVFLGRHLSLILTQIEETAALSQEAVKKIDLGLQQMPDIQVDNTDRNRTSPFAFTGNKFEFRAVGSSQSVSIPTAFLNAAISESLNEMNAELVKLPKVDEENLLPLLRTFIVRSKSVRFEDNNYSAEWVEEAERRSLSNLKTTPEAYTVWNDPDTRKFVLNSGLLNEQELDAHYYVRLEHYVHSRNIEAELMIRMIDTCVLPVGFRHQKELATSINALRATGLVEDNTIQEVQLKSFSQHLTALIQARDKLRANCSEVETIEDPSRQAMAYAKQVVPAMETARLHSDALEVLVPMEDWPLPTYHELLFLM